MLLVNFNWLTFNDSADLFDYCSLGPMEVVNHTATGVFRAIVKYKFEEAFK